MKVLIADDHQVIRSGVKIILTSEFENIELGEASNSIEVFKRLKTEKWDILILDMNMGDRNGLEILKQLKDEDVKIKTLMFSMHPEEQFALRALRLGAFGYLTKDAADTELVNAINTISIGKKYISNKVAELLSGQLENPKNKELHQLLSNREYQTLLLFGKGKTVSEIAQELSISNSTISTYRSRILDKMAMKTTSELIYYVMQNNLN